jgi:hypothetical protein
VQDQSARLNAGLSASPGRPRETVWPAKWREIFKKRTPDADARRGGRGAAGRQLCRGAGPLCDGRRLAERRKLLVHGRARRRTRTSRFDGRESRVRQVRS